MDLFCPHCTRRVTVPDDKAGQVLSCPLCSKQFMAPSLAPPPAAPKPAPPPPPPSPPVSSAPPQETYGMGAAPVTPPSPPPPPKPSAAPTPSQPAPVPTPPAPPPPPGEYTRSCSCQLTGDWLAFVPPVFVLLIFFLSFFSWHNIDATHSPSLWGMSFSSDMSKIEDAKLRDEVKQAHFLFYTILMFPSLVLCFLALPFDKGWIPAPPQVAPFLMFKNLLIGLILGVAFLLLCFDYLDVHFVQTRNPMTLPMKLAFRLHFLAMAAQFVLFWIHWRKKQNLPSPICEARW